MNSGFCYINVFSVSVMINYTFSFLGTMTQQMESSSSLQLEPMAKSTPAPSVLLFWIPSLRYETFDNV